MFTGIIEEKGQIVKIEKGKSSLALTIKGALIFNDLKTGDSVAVNGVCLTVKSLTAQTFTADVMRESINRSSLALLTSGDQVNLERAMAADGRFGGHIVSGHIDGTGIVKAVIKDDIAIWYELEAEDRLLKYIVEKGSIAIDGISLTVASIGPRSFKVSVIPHTASYTTIGEKTPGAVVNLETDIVGKYLERFTIFNQKESAQGLSVDFLRQAGF